MSEKKPKREKAQKKLSLQKPVERNRFFTILNLATKSADSTKAEKEESPKPDYRNGRQTHLRKTEDTSG